MFAEPQIEHTLDSSAVPKNFVICSVQWYMFEFYVPLNFLKYVCETTQIIYNHPI
jgi:hypothetical protein